MVLTVVDTAPLPGGGEFDVEAEGSGIRSCLIICRSAYLFVMKVPRRLTFLSVEVSLSKRPLG